jgi:hypothetical protein
MMSLLCRCGGTGGGRAAEEADVTDMHRHKFVAHRLRTAVGAAAVLRFKPEFESQLQLPAATARQLPLGHLCRLLHALTASWSRGYSPSALLQSAAAPQIGKMP